MYQRKQILSLLVPMLLVCILLIIPSVHAISDQTLRVGDTLQIDFVNATLENKDLLPKWLDLTSTLFSDTPSLVGSYDTPGTANRIVFKDDLAFIADGGGSGLHIINVTDPTQPTQVGVYATAAFARDVAIQGDLVYLVDQANGLFILNVSDPTSPSLVKQYVSPGQGFGITLDGDLAFLSMAAVGGLQIVNTWNNKKNTYEKHRH